MNTFLYSCLLPLYSYFKSKLVCFAFYFFRGLERNRKEKDLDAKKIITWVYNLFHMNKEEYNKKLADLFQRWQNSNPDFNKDGNRFTIDGIINFEKWGKAFPKILFLLKENFSEDWDPIDGINPNNNNVFSLNIARWWYIINSLYKYPHIMPDIENVDLPNLIDDISIVELKKLNEGKNISKNSDLKYFAIKDKEFIKEEIDLIDPNIVICANLGDIYGDNIYDDPWEKIISDSKCHCYKHNNRLVIDMYHPSTRSYKREVELFNVLCRMIVNGKVFQYFDWAK